MDLNPKFLSSASVFVLGVVALVYGVSLISVPAALIVLGALLMAVGVLPDWGA